MICARTGRGLTVLDGPLNISKTRKNPSLTREVAGTFPFARRGGIAIIRPLFAKPAGRIGAPFGASGLDGSVNPLYSLVEQDRSRTTCASPPCAPSEDRAGQLRSNLRAILGEGAAFNAMVGVGENYLPAFVLALGLGQVAAGLVSTLPLMSGAVLQLVSPWAVSRLGSHRRWVILCAALQAASFVPLALAARFGHMPMLAVFAVAAWYFGSGMGTTSAWSTWVDSLVPGRIRARYFARRTRVGQMAMLCGFVAGGVSLQVGAAMGDRLTIFACMFLVAALCRST